MQFGLAEIQWVQIENSLKPCKESISVLHLDVSSMAGAVEGKRGQSACRWASGGLALCHLLTGRVGEPPLRSSAPLLGAPTAPLGSDSVCLAEGWVSGDASPCGRLSPLPAGAAAPSRPLWGGGGGEAEGGALSTWRWGCQGLPSSVPVLCPRRPSGDL